jgi:hypothetical protein
MSAFFFFGGQFCGQLGSGQRGMFKIPNCFFFLGKRLGRGNREWDMGINDLIASFFL